MERVMTTPFESYTFSDAMLALTERWSVEDEESLAYYEGDHWQDGRGWKGPQFKGTDPAAQVIQEGIQRDFTSQNVLRSGVRRARRGVLGRVPGWIVSLRDGQQESQPEGEGGNEVRELSSEQQALIDEAYALIREWWSNPEVFRSFKKATTYRLACRRGPLRFYVPPSEFVAAPDGRRGIPKADPKTVAEKIHLLAPKPRDATVVTDPVTMRKASVCSVMDGNKRRVELSYVGDDGRTVVRFLDEQSSFGSAVGHAVHKAVSAVSKMLSGTGAEGSGEENTWTLPLGGRLMVVEMEGEEFVTVQVRQNQALVAKGLTMLSHNMDTAGFRERVYFNAKPPGRTVEVDDPTSPSGKTKVFIPGTISEGPGARAFLEGVSYTDTGSDGKKVTRLATPGMDVIEPIETESFENTARVGRRNILDEMDQLHIEIAAESTVSGESRRQARDDHEKSLKELKLEVDPVGSDVFETFLALVTYFSGNPGRYDSLKVSFSAHVDPGPLAADDRRMVIEEVKEGIRSRESAMMIAGLDDPDAELSKIIEERESQSRAEPEE